MSTMTTERLQALLHEHDNGLLYTGAHTPGSREFCALEFDAMVRGRAWSDQPITLPDLRPLNDAQWDSDAQRTAALLPVMAALWDWATWSTVRRQAWATYVSIHTVRGIISQLPGISTTHREMCLQAVTVAQAREAARQVRDAASDASDAAYASYTSAASASYASDAADASAASASAAAAAGASAAAYASAASASASPLLTACRIWSKACVATAEL